MKLGSLVLTTSHPFIAPMAAAKTKVSRMAGQTSIPAFVTSRPMKSPVEPTMTPAERSNSPPIINRATATATMPVLAAESLHRAIPLREANFPVWSTVVKSTKTTRAPMSAPNSGRRRRRMRALAR